MSAMCGTEEDAVVSVFFSRSDGEAFAAEGVRHTPETSIEGDIGFGGAEREDFFSDNTLLGIEGSGGSAIKGFDFADEALNFLAADQFGLFQYIGSVAVSGDRNSEARFAGKGTRQVQVDRVGDGVADINFKIDGLTAADQLSDAYFIW